MCDQQEKTLVSMSQSTENQDWDKAMQVVISGTKFKGMPKNKNLSKK